MQGQGSSTRVWVLWGLATLGWMGGLWWLSAQPGSSVQIASPWDKLAHGSAYVVLGGLAGAGSGNARRGFMIAALYGAIDEAHQVFSPGRTSGFPDWFADLAGGLIGALVSARGRVG